MKNFRIGSWLNLFAAVAGIVGLIALIVSNSISSAYALKSAGLVTVMAIGGILLALVAIWSPT